MLILMENSGSQLELPLSLPYLGGSLAVGGDIFLRHKPEWGEVWNAARQPSVHRQPL